MAIENGWRHIDSACDYGNEKEVGLGIKEGIRKSNLTREDLFVTSKLWNTYHSPEHVEAACRRTLEDLGLEVSEDEEQRMKGWAEGCPVPTNPRMSHLFRSFTAVPRPLPYPLSHPPKVCAVRQKVPPGVDPRSLLLN